MIDILAMLEAMREGAAPPMSFRYGQAPATLTLQRVRESGGDERGEATFVYQVDEAPIRVLLDCTHVAEWNLLTFRATLQATGTPNEAIRDVRVLDLRCHAGDDVKLRGWNGGWVYDRNPQRNNADTRWPAREFAIWDRDLAGEGEVSLEDLTGRSSTIYLPIWMLHGPEAGVWFGPEWSGSWRMTAGLAAEEASARVELPLLDFKMLQGEEIALPAVSMGTYAGDVWQGCVHLRRTIREEFLPDLAGQRPLPQAGYHVIGGSTPKFDPDGLAAEMRLAQSLGLENFVWASGWYRPPEGTKSPFQLEELQQWFPERTSKADYEIWAWWEQCGAFVPDETRFPDGLAEHAAEINRMGISLGLWFDPRVNRLTDEYARAEDVLLTYKASDGKDNVWTMGLIDLRTQAGRRYMFELLETFVVDYGADYLWHDLNVDPRQRYWDDVEEPHRRGLAELMHYNGMDEVYDAFHAAYPHVTIEWCGGGGSMIHLGTLRRAHTFFIADYNDLPGAAPEQLNTDRGRCYRTCLNWILPSVYLTNFLSIPTKAYEHTDRIGIHNFLPQMGSSLSYHQYVSEWSEGDLADADLAVRTFKHIRRFLDGDFWGLFGAPTDETGWDGWQFHDPQTATGVIFLFKMRDCTETKTSIAPRWLSDPAKVRFRQLIGSPALTPAGKGFDVTMAEQGALVMYEDTGAAAGQGGEA
jgi:hypothetical protein